LVFIAVVITVCCKKHRNKTKYFHNDKQEKVPEYCFTEVKQETFAPGSNNCISEKNSDRFLEYTFYRISNSAPSTLSPLDSGVYSNRYSYPTYLDDKTADAHIYNRDTLYESQDNCFNILSVSACLHPNENMADTANQDGHSLIDSEHCSTNPSFVCEKNDENF